jgi:tRNA(His) 5'-end guanylyltransferase
MDNTALAKRMKKYYEEVPKTRLIRRMPVCIRLDGKAFHTFLKGFKKPFDDIFIKTMQDTMRYLCQNIQGCVLGYSQSDEISLILIDYQKLTTSAWFDYNVQKICSVSSSMATLTFNKLLKNNVDKYKVEKWDGVSKYKNGEDEYIETLLRAVDKGAMFDSRCFNIPKEEVANLIFWRQFDASNNSVQMVGQAYFTQEELNNKNTNQIQDMLMTQKGINWNDYPIYQKRGSCCIKRKFWIDKNDGCEFSEEYSCELEKAGVNSDNAIKKTEWIIDKNIPIFKGENRKYINELILFKE